MSAEMTMGYTGILSKGISSYSHTLVPRLDGWLVDRSDEFSRMRRTCSVAGYHHVVVDH